MESKASAAGGGASLSGGRIGGNAALVSEPETHDVILGRGRAHERHEGNRRYQALIDLYYEHYINAKLHMKTEVSSMIVDAVMCRGRFLKEDKSQGKWKTISKKEARVKVAHCFQYRRRRSSLFVSECDSDSLREDEEEDGDSSLEHANGEMMLDTTPSAGDTDDNVSNHTEDELDLLADDLLDIDQEQLNELIAEGPAVEDYLSDIWDTP